MSAISELECLKAKRQDAFLKKQALFEEYRGLKRRIDDLYVESRKILDEKTLSHEEMVCADRTLKEKKRQYNAILEEYESHYVKREECLRQSSEHARISAVGYAKMADNYQRAGDEENAQSWRDEALKYQGIHDFLEQQITELCKGKELAKRRIDGFKLKKYSDAFNRAKNSFKRAKARYESIQNELRVARRERDRKQEEFEAAQAECSKIEIEYSFELRDANAAKRRKTTT